MVKTITVSVAVIAKEPDIDDFIEDAKRGDTTALAALYDAHVQRIYRYIIFRVRHTEEAEDLTEQVFMKMLESIHTFQPGRAPFSAWLFRIAHNLLMDYERKRRSRARYVQLEAPLLRTDDPADLALLNVQTAAVRKALLELPLAQQQVIALRFGGQRSTAEVAQIMSRSEAAIKSLQYKAIKTLRRILDGGEAIQ